MGVYPLQGPGSVILLVLTEVVTSQPALQDTLGFFIPASGLRSLHNPEKYLSTEVQLVETLFDR